MRLSDQKESAPCLGENDIKTDFKMLSGARRRIALDVAMACWGLGTWLGVNGLYMQLPLLVETLPERWKLGASMALAVQFANAGLLLYALLRRILPRVPDSVYIYALLTIGTLSLTLNSFLYPRTAHVGGQERSVAFLVLTLFAALVGCTSSVLFYPYLRHFREMYLVTYLVGEGLSGFIPSVLALIQGIGEPKCVPSADNSTLIAEYSPRFSTTAYMLLLGVLSAVSLTSFTTLANCRAFDSERVAPAAAAKSEEAAAPRAELLSAKWISVLALMMCLNALSNGVLPSIQTYSCMPYGNRAYHLAVALGALANPAACLAGVWLRPAPARPLAAALVVSLLPLGYILATALLSPTPPLHDSKAIGEVLIVLSWVLVTAVVSYCRMWVYGWARAGGARGMRATGAVTQAGSLCGSVLLFVLVNYTSVFVQAATCPDPAPAHL